MSDEPLAPVDARHELFELATSVRALIDWYDMTGVTGVPRGAVDPEPIAAPMPQAMRAPMQPPTSRKSSICNSPRSRILRMLTT